MRGRPRTHPRLMDLDPVAVAREVAGLLERHVTRQVMRLVPGYQLMGGLPDGAEHCDLGLTVQALVRWAQTGEGAASAAWDAAQAVCEALYSQAGEPGTFGAGEIDGAGDPATPIGVVLLATSARYQMAHAEPVSARALGALAGIAKGEVNARASRGAIKRGAGGGFSAREAGRLLATVVGGDEVARQLLHARAATRYVCGRGQRALVVRGELAVATLATARGWERRGDAWIARAEAETRTEAVVVGE